MTIETRIVFVYTRAQAIADGILVDVGEMGAEAGFRYPVAVTRTVWERCVRVPDDVSGQDETGRLWDVLMMLKSGVKKAKWECETMLEVLVRNDETKLSRHSLKAICGPGDDGEPVITIMLPEED